MSKETPDRIYHYTSIESLALILKSRKLRFTRLDRVDDVKEAQVRNGVQFGKYFFISCWTADARESIPQWNMYSRDMEGVRIELPSYPFMKKDISIPPRGFDVMGDLRNALSPFSWDEMSGPDYLIVPMFLKSDFFAGGVEYVDDLAIRYSEAVKRAKGANGREMVSVENLPSLTRTKERAWEFQKEFRFSLFVVPVPSLPPGTSPTDVFVRRIDHVSRSVLSGKELTFDHVHVDLGDQAFSELVVRTGPHCSAGGRACVEALLHTYAPDARLEESHLAGSIRRRG